MSAPSNPTTTAAITMASAPPDTFPYFPLLPLEIQDKIWEESFKGTGVQFFKIYASRNRQDTLVFPYITLDKHSRASYLARMKKVCTRANNVISRMEKFGIQAGQMISMRIDTLSGTQVIYIDKDDLVCLSPVLDSVCDYSKEVLPTKRGGIPEPWSIFMGPRLANLEVPSGWKFIRRLGLSWNLDGRKTEHEALAGVWRHPFSCRAVNVCLYCIWFNLTSMPNLEEVYLIMPNAPKPTAAHLAAHPHHMMIQQDSQDLSDEVLSALEDPDCREYDPRLAPPENLTISSMSQLATFQGDREFYQVCLNFFGLFRTEHMSLREFARGFAILAQMRVYQGSDVQVCKNIKFKLLSYDSR